MSSKLSRAKRKKKPNYGWMQSEIDAIGEYQSRINWMSKMSSRAYTNIKEISLWVLHDKFGFGIKRLNRVNEQVRSCVLKNDQAGIKVDHMILYYKEKMDIDIYVECKSIPRNTRYQIAGIEHPKNTRDMMDYTQAATLSCALAICMVCTELQEIEKFSKNQIRKFVDECIFLINEYMATGYICQNDIKVILRDEVKFDIRGENNGKN